MTSAQAWLSMRYTKFVHSMGPLAASSQNANRFMDTSLSTIWVDCKSKLSSCPPYFSLKNLFCQRPGLIMILSYYKKSAGTHRIYLPKMQISATSSWKLVDTRYLVRLHPFCLSPVEIDVVCIRVTVRRCLLTIIGAIEFSGSGWVTTFNFQVAEKTAYTESSWALLPHTLGGTPEAIKRVWAWGSFQVGPCCLWEQSIIQNRLPHSAFQPVDINVVCHCIQVVLKVASSSNRYWSVRCQWLRQICNSNSSQNYYEIY